MNPAHVHLLLVHVPVLGAYFGLALLLYAWVRKKDDVMRVSYGVFVLVGLFATVVYLTGEQAEEIVENIAGVTHDVIEAHEEFALAALVSSIVLGVAGLAGIVVSVRRHLQPTWLKASVLVLAVVTSGIMAQTAYLGGQINHPEIRSEQEAGGSAVVADDSEH